MKKNILIVLGLTLTLNIYSQKKEKFKAGVKLTENNIPKEFKSTNSILFFFKNGGCGPNFYIDLKKHIEKKFKKSNKKIDFIFSPHYLTYGEKTPTTIDSLIKHELICEISEENFNGWDNNLHKKRKQNYDLVLTVKKGNSDSIIGFATLNINSYWNITTQNKNMSKLIYKLFND